MDAMTRNGPPTIALADYWMGRDRTHPRDLTEAVKSNAFALLQRVNRLLPLMTGVDFELNPRTGTLVSSGWRPPSINATTPGAAPKSLHMTGQAIDLYDPDGDIDDWCMSNQHVLARVDIDLYIEHPSQTKGWCHLQSVPPRSQARFEASLRRRWFYA